MADIALGTVLFCVSAILGILLSQLDKLLAPIDPEPPRVGDLDSMEMLAIERNLVPLAKRIAKAQAILPKRDIDEIRHRYHHDIAAVERARIYARDFGNARRNLFRSLVGAAILLVPAAALAAASTGDGWVLVTIGVLLALSVGFAFTAAYALLQLRQSRKQYASVTAAFMERLASQPLLPANQHSPGGKGHA